MSLPDFIGIGAQRSGTTRLYEFLKQHPEVCMPRHRKEVHYFDRYYHKGEAWYRSLFDGCKGKTAGEITPAYIYNERCAERIYALLPDVKLVAALRNPIDRAYSQFKFTIREEQYKGSFTDFLEDHKDAMERGLYHRQISKYLEYFSPRNLKILLFEDMVANPIEEISEIFTFLGVDPSFTPVAIEKKVNPSQIPRFHSLYVLGKKVTSKIHDHDLVWIIEGLKKIGMKRFFFSQARNKGSAPRLTQHEYIRLRQYYEEDVMKLSSFLNRDLKKLWHMED